MYWFPMLSILHAERCNLGHNAGSHADVVMLNVVAPRVSGKASWSFCVVDETASWWNDLALVKMITMGP